VHKRELERKAEIAELLLDAARELGETLEPERVYERFHQLLANVVEHDGIIVSSYDERDCLIRCEYAWVEENLLDPATFPMLPLNREGGGMQSRVIMSGRPLLVNDFAGRVHETGAYYDVDREGTIRKVPEAGTATTRAAIMVPVKDEGRVVGVVQIMSERLEYSPEQLALVEGLVAQMAAAVRNARLQKERRRLEIAEAAAQAVAAERQQAAQVLDAVGDGIFLVDGDGVIRLWNRAAELTTGLPAAAANGRRVAEIFQEWQAIAERVPVEELGAAARPVTLPIAVDDRELWLSFVAVHSVDGVVYTFRDVTGERRLDEEKRDFVATISHELRTPMAAIYGAAETLRQRSTTLTQGHREQLVEMIATQAARLSQITEEVLLTTRLDREEVTVEHESVDAGDLVRATVKALREQLPRSTKISIAVDRRTGAASGDAARIQQVLFNLIENAAKYGNGSPIRVEVKRANGVVRIAVADSGPGISSSDQARIFEKFYRADPQHTNAPGGTGLGLYISRQLVERMGGRLNVRSEVGAGATFIVELPGADAPVRRPTRRAQSRARAREA
jgi:two-component system phosphate regulon sensor histidine kinase PhoR